MATMAVTTAINKIVLSLQMKVILPVVFLLAIVAWVFLCQAHYRSYWEGTIYRVQTVDFNLLHHTLPQTLSQLIVAGSDEEIQKVLDSTYGLLGLVVTNPSGTTILYRTHKVYHRPSWQNLVSPEYLSGLAEPYDLLTDPPPDKVVFEHASPRQAQAVEVAAKPKGRVLGRIYYVRSVPPTLVEDVVSFFSTGVLELSGAKRGYLYISLSTLGFSFAFIFIVAWRKRELEIKQRQLQDIASNLEIKQKALNHLSVELLAQKTRKEWLEKEADRAYQRALSLKGALERLRKSFGIQGAAQGQGGLSEVVEQLNLKPLLHRPSALLEEVEALIPELTDNATLLKVEASQLQEHCAQLEERQAEMRKIIEEASSLGLASGGNVFNFKAK